MAVLELEHIAKAFGGRQIIKDVSLTVPEHCIYGFIGQNGAGKTTTMKMILGLLRLDAGEIRVCGKKAAFGQNETNQYIGYLPDVPEFYEFMTPKEYLMFCGELTGMSKEKARVRAEELLELVGLSGANKRIRGFSRGMKQRLGVAQALFHRPKLLICDEPTSALDPLGRRELLDILVKAKEETTILFSTHILSDVERICDKIAFLHQGEIVLQGELEDIRRQHAGRNVEIEFQTPKEAKRFEEALQRELRLQKSSTETLEWETRGVLVKIPETVALAALSTLAGQGLCPVRFERLEPDLEELFLEVIGK